MLRGILISPVTAETHRDNGAKGELPTSALGGGPPPIDQNTEIMAARKRTSPEKDENNVAEIGPLPHGVQAQRQRALDAGAATGAAPAGIVWCTDVS